MANIKWANYSWLPREKWGVYHPNKTYCYYDRTAIDINDKDELILKTQYNPKKFKKPDIEIPIGVGLVSCKENLDMVILNLKLSYLLVRIYGLLSG